MTGSEQFTSRLREEMIAALPRLRRFARTLAGNDDLGDDIVAQAIERAMASAADVRDGAPMDNRMYRIAHRLWIERGIEMGLDDSSAGTAAGPAELRQAMAGLPTDQRMLVLLVLVEARSCREAADTLDIPLAAATGLLSRARATLEAGTAA